MEKEIWRPVEGRETYYLISNTGKVKSLVNRYKTKGEFELKQCANNKGYYYVDLAVPELKKCAIHRLVAGAFCSKPEGCNVVNHLDNNPANNHYTNLEWTTYSGNLLHAQAQGRLFNTQSKGGKTTGDRATKSLFSDTEAMVGKTYGNLTVLREGKTVKYGIANRPRLLCRCSCGNEQEYCKIQLEKQRATRCKVCASRDLGFTKRQQRIDGLKGIQVGFLTFTGNSTNSNKIDMKNVKVELFNNKTQKIEWYSYRNSTSLRFLNKHKDIV